MITQQTRHSIGFIAIAALLCGESVSAAHAQSPVLPIASLNKAKLPKPPPDPQALVNKGKRPAFFDAKDLSKSPIVSAKAAILIDADTQQVLWEKNADEVRAPASTTKILTGLIFAERTKSADVVTCLDPSVTKIEESSLHIRPWETFTSRDLLYGLMLRSANDGAVVIAQHVAGSVAKFSDAMNARAAELGATNTHFVNPNGLHDPYHYTTARDLSKIAAAAMQNPRFADSVRVQRRKIKRSKQTRDIVVASKARKFYKFLPGADGIKTGYVRQSGQCFVGSAKRDGRRLLCVILGANGNASGEAIPVLSWGFRRFPKLALARKLAPVGEVPVQGGASANVAVIAARNLHVTTDSLARNPNVPVGAADVVTQIVPVLPGGVAAPVRKGQEVGRFVASRNGAEVASVALYAARDVETNAQAALVQSLAGGNGGGGGIGWLWGTLGGGGAIALLLVGWNYGTATAKSARRRRNRVKTFFGNTDSARPRAGGQPDGDKAGNARRPDEADGHG